MQPTNQTFFRPPRTPYTLFKLLTLLLISGVFTMIVVINSTPGQFGYADTDGCSCSVTYTTHQAQPSCEPARYQQCDGFRIDRVLLYVSYLDFNT